jgi:hypothetical protein
MDRKAERGWICESDSKMVDHYNCCRGVVMVRGAKTGQHVEISHRILHSNRRRMIMHGTNSSIWRPTNKCLCLGWFLYKFIGPQVFKTKPENDSDITWTSLLAAGPLNVWDL